MFGSVCDLEALLGLTISDDDPRANLLLAQASGVVAAYLAASARGSLPDTWMFADPRDTVTLSLAARLWTGVPGVKQRSESLGGWSENVTFTGSDGVDISLTSGERALLDAAFRPLQRPVRSIRLQPTPVPPPAGLRPS